MTDTIDLLLDAVQEVYGEKTPNEALRPPFIEHVEQARADERKKVLSEVLEMVKHQRLSPKDGYFTDERKRHQNSLRAELRTKLNQLKEGKC